MRKPALPVAYAGDRARPWRRELPPTLVERALNNLSDARRRDLLFLRSHWRLPSHRKPRTLMEKVNWRIVHDRRDIIAWACDKLATKELAERYPSLRVPRTYWAGMDLSELLEVDLPDRWILKPNNASGLIIHGAGRPDRQVIGELEKLTEGWYPPQNVTELCEWAYTKCRPLLFVEECISEVPPTDFKFWVFDGEPRIVQVDVDRFTAHHMSFYAPDWTYLPAHSRFPPGQPMARPLHLDRMFEAARLLARDFDFLRVDLYDVGGEVWFGELTPYPGSGLMKITPARYDRVWGDLWSLPQLTS